MPELPEVETTCRGIEKYLLNKKIERIVVRQWQLRYPISKNIKAKLQGKSVVRVERRAKYILLHVEQSGFLLVHLGMSGSLRIVMGAAIATPQKHDHVDFYLNDNCVLRYRDPRRFGLILWTTQAYQHKLLAQLGPEPLAKNFNGTYLYAKAQTRQVAVKPFIMNQKIVVGVGNIYAGEALFMSGIHPERAAHTLSIESCHVLAANIKKILKRAIAQGGTTLKDFVNGDGQPGYFQQQLLVYGRGGQKCGHCATVLKEIKLAQRSTVYCAQCQS